MKKYNYYIGIDTGVNTGCAIWDGEEFYSVESVKIHEAMCNVELLKHSNVFVRVEDARLRKWIPKSRGREALQGVGSVKRDAKIWEDFLTDNKIPFELVAPKNNKTKLNAESFKKITGWKGKTNEHSRDAGMLVFGL